MARDIQPLTSLNDFNNVHQMKEVFLKLSEARTIGDLQAIINQYNFSSDIQEFKDKYPDVDLTISEIDINNLMKENFITEDHKIQLSGDRKFSTFEKLLLSVLWK